MIYCLYAALYGAKWRKAPLRTPFVLLLEMFCPISLAVVGLANVVAVALLEELLGASGLAEGIHAVVHEMPNLEGSAGRTGEAFTVLDAGLVPGLLVGCRSRSGGLLGVSLEGRAQRDDPSQDGDGQQSFAHFHAFFLQKTRSAGGMPLVLVFSMGSTGVSMAWYTFILPP